MEEEKQSQLLTLLALFESIKVIYLHIGIYTIFALILLNDLRLLIIVNVFEVYCIFGFGLMKLLVCQHKKVLLIRI